MIESIKKIIYNIMNRIFPIAQRFGINITYNHYYSTIPDINKLDEKIWKKRTKLVGININEDKQLYIRSIYNDEYKEEYYRFPWNKTEINKPYDYYLNNPSFGSISGPILYSMIRYYKPSKIIEIGSGYSTYC